MKIIYENLIDSETGKPFELEVPDNFEFSSESDRIRIYARVCANQRISLVWNFLNSDDNAS